MFDNHGNLPPGFHDWTFEEAGERFVRAFTESRTRARIWSGYSKLCNELLTIIDECELWLDGSFVTFKPNPGDLDLLVVAEKSDLDRLPEASYRRFRELVDGSGTRARYACDSYLLKKVSSDDPWYDEYRARRKYWMGEFGFDRDDHPKGIIRVRVAAATWELGDET